MNYANPFKRFLAFIVDIFIIIILYTFIGVLSLWILGWLGLVEPNHPRAIMSTYFLFPIIYCAYFVLSGRKFCKTTLGKRLFKLKIVYLKGENTIGKPLMRAIFVVISILPFYIGIIMMFFNKRRQTLHDIICGTVVVEETERKA